MTKTPSSPQQVFEYLREQNLPLILSFPLIEEKGHIITGRGLCYVEQIHGSSRMTLGRFSPFRVLSSLSGSLSFFATFEIRGATYGCTIEDIVCDRTTLTAGIPSSLSRVERRFVRVQPSRSAPVAAYLGSEEYGTMAFQVRDLSEQGLGLLVESKLRISGRICCGIRLPQEGGTFLMIPAEIVYQKDFSLPHAHGGMHAGRVMIFCGIELFPHGEDLKKLRQYVMQRELEIRRKIQQEW